MKVIILLLLIIINLQNTWNQILDTKLKQKWLLDKPNSSNLVKHSDLNTKLAALARKPEFKAEEDERVKLQAFDLTYSRGKSHFEDDGKQNYLGTASS